VQRRTAVQGALEEERVIEVRIPRLGVGEEIHQRVESFRSERVTSRRSQKSAAVKRSVSVPIRKNPLSLFRFPRIQLLLLLSRPAP
jgi:hypothetical protein